MSVFNIKPASLQGLKGGLYLLSFPIKDLSLIGFIERHDYLKFRNILFVYYSGCRQITEFSINPDYSAMEGTQVNPEITEQPPGPCLLPVTRYFNPEVLTYSNVILNV